MFNFKQTEYGIIFDEAPKSIRKLCTFLLKNSKVHQVIDIIVVDIPEFYGLILSRDWYEKLHGYLAIDWSHMWLPCNGKPN